MEWLKSLMPKINFDQYKTIDDKINPNQNCLVILRRLGYDTDAYEAGVSLTVPYSERALNILKRRLPEIPYKKAYHGGRPYMNALEDAPVELLRKKPEALGVIDLQATVWRTDAKEA